MALLEGNRVFVVEDEVLRERHVRTGLRNWNHVEILEGLHVGDIVVTSLESEDLREGVACHVTEVNGDSDAP